MFYTYALTADSAGSNNFSKSVGCASTETASSTPRLGSQHVAVGAAIRQSIGVLPPSPWSTDWSADFGAGTSYILMSVGKLLRCADTESALLTKAKITGGVGYTKAVPVASGQTSFSFARYLALLSLPEQSTQVVTLTFPRLYRVIQAYVAHYSAVVTRRSGRLIGLVCPANPFSNEFSSEFGSGPGGHMEHLALTIGRFFSPTIFGPATGGQTASLLKTGGRRLAALGPSVASLLNGPVRVLHAASAAAQARVLTVGKLAAATSASLGHSLLLRPLHLGGVSGQSPRLSFGGGNFFVRSLNAVSTQAVVVVRGMSSLRGTASAEFARATRAGGKLLLAISTATQGLLKAATPLRGAVSPETVGALRSAGIPRGVAAASVAAFSTAASHFKALVGAAQAQVAAAPRMLARGLSVGLGAAQKAGLLISSVLSRLLALHTAQAQSASLVRGTGRISGMASAMAEGMARAISLASRSVTSAEVVALLAPGAHFVRAAVAGAMAVLRVSSYPRGFSVASAEVVRMVGGGRVTIRLLGSASASAAFLRRLTGKLLGVATLGVASVGRVDFKVIGAAMANIASVSYPHGVILTAFQRQRAAVVRWFHLFVPDWAYQQSILLPPGGGPAEPPAFGPIDPADQTTFAFNWSARADFNDPIVSATVVSIPAGMTFLGPVFTDGMLVEVTALPFTPPQIPATYLLRCTCSFASGRRSSFSIPVPVRTL